MSNTLNFPLSIDELLYAAIIALFITWFIQMFLKLRKIFKNTSNQFGYPNRDLTKIMQRCYALFPKEIIQFRGQTFKRGMKIQIITLQKKSFEGEFIGSNNKDMVCILTKKYIIAHEINNIEQINIIEKV